MNVISMPPFKSVLQVLVMLPHTHERFTSSQCIYCLKVKIYVTAAERASRQRRFQSFVHPAVPVLNETRYRSLRMCQFLVQELI